MKCFVSQTLSFTEDLHFLGLQKEMGLDTTRTVPEEGFYLQYTPSEQSLSLHKAHSQDLGLCISFSDLKQKFQQQKLSAKKDLLARALGLTPGMTIFDGTLGLAQDAFKLCYLGAKVIGAESNPWVYALLKNALYRERELVELQNLTPYFSLAQSLLEKVNPVDAIYLDPMFVHRKKALPKKGMQYLAELVEGEESDFATMLESFKNYAPRLVVKRSLNAEPLCGKKPSHSIEGKMIRFDVYS